MKRKNLLAKNIAAIFVAALVTFSWGIDVLPLNVDAADVHVVVEYEPTIRMGDHAPMTHNEFLEWGSQRGIRHVNIEESILPITILFRGNNGQAFEYTELRGTTLYIARRPGVVSNPRAVPLTETPIAKTQPLRTVTPVLFCSRAPVHLSQVELAAIMENAPPCPMYTRSEITLPNRRLTEAELDAWIDEYNEMGGASALELAVVMEVNRVRAEYGLHPLALSPALMMSERLKTQEFGDLQYFGHHSPVHGPPWEAAKMFGFDGLAGETISRTGSNTAPIAPRPERVVGGMLASTRGHREILLSPTAYSVGFGIFFSSNSTGATGNLTHSFYVATKFGFTTE
jgi:uncharacterized protein YkwD